MSHKSNRQLMEEQENRTRLRKQCRSVNRKKINGQPPVKKIYKEDWRTIFEALSLGIDEILCKEIITQQDASFIRKRIGLCEKILPKFLEGDTCKYRHIVCGWQQTLDALG